MPRAGRLRKRITIQSKGTPSRNDFNEEVITWTAVATVWASKAPMNGREFLDAQREVAELWTRFYIRYRSDITITPAMRISTDSGAHLYDIQAVQNVNDKNQELLILCREVVDA